MGGRQARRGSQGGERKRRSGVRGSLSGQSVNTQVPTNSCTWTPTLDPGFAPPSTKPWSLITNLDWLKAHLN
ncbi:MAG TPA: hypothetical protein VMU39_03265 [Solirubrobacteraceae bacterium]|nr:hypothetical protein [Solirubrobacteraceae bacterium]